MELFKKKETFNYLVFCANAYWLSHRRVLQSHGTANSNLRFS